MRRLALLTALVLGCISTRPVLAAPADAACEAPDDTAGVASPLLHVAAAFKPGATLHVLAIGSASMFGPEASLSPGSLTAQAVEGATSTTLPPAQILNRPASDAAFPQRMGRALEAAMPGAKVDVTIRGGRGLTATDQLSLLDEALAKGKYSLVLWQTGTVEAVRNLPPAEFATTLAEGAAHVEQADADLILIDPQFSRFLQTNSNIEPYEQAFQQLSSVPGVALFHRFDLMRSWVGDGHIDLERTSKPDRRRAVEQLHTCLGDQLAKVILNGLHP